MIGRSPFMVRSLRHRGLKALRGVLEIKTSSVNNNVHI